MRLEPALPQIHQQEGQVVEDVDTGQIVVELDGIKQRGAAIKQHDVAKMQVAVALAHRAGKTARLEKRTAAAQPQPRRGCQRLAGSAGESVRTERSKGLGVALDDTPDSCHASQRWPRFASVVKRRDL